MNYIRYHSSRRKEQRTNERITFTSGTGHDYLIDLIKQGTLQENTIYSLNQMAKEAGFSRTPFRDAVLRLEQERYLDILPSKGFILHKMTREDILETYEIRNAIEVFCFKQLSLHLDTERGKQYYTKLCTKVEAQKEILATSGSYEILDEKIMNSIVVLSSMLIMLPCWKFTGDSCIAFSG